MARYRSLAARVLACLVLGLLVGFDCVAAPAATEEMQAPEYRVKAAFVYKFGDYVEWPADAFSSPSSPLMIGIVGADALADELTRIVAGRNVGGRPVMVKKMRRGEPLTGLHVIFLGRSGREQLLETLAASKGLPALTVSESADGLRLGSMINMVVVSDKVRFDVALPPAEASRLKISSRLLSVARKVVASPP